MAADDPFAPWRADPRRAGILTDFDGTLAPIVEDPDAAVPLPGAVTVLRRLSRRYRRVGVVSGRSVAYLQRRFEEDTTAAPTALVLSGLYGLERWEDGRSSVRAGAEPWAEVVERAAGRAEREVPAGVGVERKGLALTLHVRRAPQHAGWVGRFAAEIAAGTGLEASGGRMLVELRPPLDVDKGTIVRELAEGLRAVCFFGDDVGDLPAFAALGRLRRAGVATVAVAARSAESPPDLLDAADLVVDGPAGVLAIMESLADDGG